MPSPFVVIPEGNLRLYLPSLFHPKQTHPTIVLTKLQARILFTLLALICGSASVHRLHRMDPIRIRQPDFEVYYTAGSLILNHQPTQIYNGADTGQDPQLLFAAPDSLFAQTARSLGIPAVRLYVYPPTLADLIAPLAALPIAKAIAAWKLLTVLALLAAALLLASILRLPFWSLGTLSLVAAILLFGPAPDCLQWGQITAILMALEVAGLALYARGHKLAATFFFALSTAIKLTPAIVLLPLLMARDWKALRAFTLWCATFLAALWAINGRALLADYTLHVLPAMSHGIVEIGNRNLNTTFLLTWHLLHQPGTPAWLSTLARLANILVLAWATWQSRGQQDRNPLTRAATLSLFLLLACCTAPVSWWHAYVLCAPALVLLGSDALKGRLTYLEAAVMTFFLLALSQGSPTDPIRIPLALGTPIFGITLALAALHRMRRRARSAPAPSSVGFRPVPDSMDH